jgi:hypothetical protein
VLDPLNYHRVGAELAFEDASVAFSSKSSVTEHENRSDVFSEVCRGFSSHHVLDAKTDISDSHQLGCRAPQLGFNAIVT